ncbi:MAG: hypothetical protein Q7K28_01120 [Candidatus Wildermuthbacteria bacterium]|nr:hypothetical protein [Candidatus Wildermuthbacteria bacterium]
MPTIVGAEELYGIWDNWLLTAIAALSENGENKIYNGHTHLDRAYTLSPEYLEHVRLDPLRASTSSLQTKQDLMGYLHFGKGYSKEDLYVRMKAVLEKQLRHGTGKITSFIDASPDIGLRAIEQAVRLREEFAGKLELKIAVSPIFGFKEALRWEIYQEAAKIADVLGGLPSKDERKDSIGFKGHVKKILELGIQLGKPVHFQVDQGNDPRETETEQLIQAVKWFGSPKVKGTPDEEPTVWAVHVISPSCYSEERFRRLIDGLLENNIGVICCPSAAISMLQLRPILTPTHNSIARILEMLETGVRVIFGTDNIGDVFVPSGDGKVGSEAWCLTNILRFYSVAAWAKVCAGLPLNSIDKDGIREYLNRMEEGFKAQGLDPKKIYVPDDLIGRELTSFNGDTLIIKRLRK